MLKSFTRIETCQFTNESIVTEIHMTHSYSKKGQRAYLKNIDADQLAQSTQADLGRNFFVVCQFCAAEGPMFLSFWLIYRVGRYILMIGMGFLKYLILIYSLLKSPRFRQ